MTKKTPKSRSSPAAASGVQEAEILPSGGLALTALVITESASNDTTPGAATPASESSAGGGYFAQFEGFTPEVNASFLNQFNKLAIQENWSQSEKTRRRNEAAEIEFAHYFGTDYHNVARWQDLCRLVGLNAEGLTSITKCKKAIGSRKVMVNLFDLVDHLKNGTPLKKFKNFWEFQRYTLKPGRCMNKKLAKTNAFVSALLRHVV